MRTKHIYVGMDVHKETNVICLAHAGRNGKVEHCGTLSSSVHSMGRFLERNRKPGVKLHFVYEADPAGFALQRRLEAWNEDCIVVSAVHVPKKAGDKVKTDRRDAEQLARMHRSGELDPIREISWNAQNRLYKRAKALGHRGVMGQKIQIAIAKELVGFVWAIGQLVGYPEPKGSAQGKGKGGSG